jgi:hypothetical protein
MEKKQTAVEWLHSEYIKIFGELNPSTGKLYEIAYALEQAKRMEKEQIIDAYYEGKEYGYKEQGEQYYNETYGGTQC